MDRDAFHILDDQAMPPEQGVQRGQGKIAEVLVVDGVELAMVQQVFHVRHLDHDDAIVLQHGFHALDHPVEIGDVG